MTEGARTASPDSSLRIAPATALRSLHSPDPITRTGATLEAQALDAWYGHTHAVRNLSLEFSAGRVTAIVGPSGCGKSTLLRCLNRLHESTPGARVQGDVWLDGRSLYKSELDAIAVRRGLGFVSQRPTPFPTMSIRENVAAGLRGNGVSVDRAKLVECVESALQRTGLWNEVKDQLDGNPMLLSGGQQQRLCLARALAPAPHVLLLDEPTTALDPAGAQRIEELVYSLRSEVTIVIVTHNMQQAARVSDRTALMLDGSLVEVAPTRQFFTAPNDEHTEQYITGRFG